MTGEGTRKERLDLANFARQRLIAGLDQVLGETFRPVKGQKPDVFTDGIVISSFSLFYRPDEDDSPPTPFMESTFTSRRRIGLMVLRNLETPSVWVGESLASCVTAVMDSPEGWPIGLRDWVESLEPAGRAAVVAATITWCEGALRLVGTDPRIVWTDPQYPTAWMAPGRLVRLSANIDAVIGTPVSGEKLLVMSDAAPRSTDRIRAGFAALVRAVGIGSAPERVTIGAPSRGTTERLGVTADLLELAVDQVIQSVALAADSRSSDRKDPTRRSDP